MKRLLLNVVRKGRKRISKQQEKWWFALWLGSIQTLYITRAFLPLCPRFLPLCFLFTIHYVGICPPRSLCTQCPWCLDCSSNRSSSQGSLLISGCHSHVFSSEMPPLTAEKQSSTTWSCSIMLSYFIFTVYQWVKLFYLYICSGDFCLLPPTLS